MKRLSILLVLVALALSAQEQAKKPQPERIQKMFVLKYADPNQLVQLLQVFGGSYTPNASMHVLAVSTTPEAMAAVEDALKRLDVPSAAPQNVDLTAYFLVGSSEAASSGTVPKDLESVVTQLRNAFTYKNYRVLDVLTLRTRTGRDASTSSSSGAVTIGNTSQPIITSFRLQSVSVSADGSIRIDGLRASNRVPVATGPVAPSAGSGSGGLVDTRFTYNDIGINTDLDIKEGQKLVVGKMGMSPNEALFLVLTARLAQ
jgi:hypothetical protein